MAEGDVNILQTMSHKVHGDKYRVPWTFKNGVYNLKINPDKKIHKANVEKLEKHITTKHVQPNLNAGRKADHGINKIIIGDDEGRVGGVDKYKAGELTIKIRSKGQAKKSYEARKSRTTQPSFAAQKQMNIYTQIGILRDGLNKKNIDQKTFDSKMSRLFKRERIQLPGLKVGQYNYEAFNKSPIANGWPAGASQEGYTKWLAKNFADFKPEQKALQAKGKGKVTGLGSKIDIGHPRQGAPNIDLTFQHRYHPTQGNQSLKGLAEEFKPTSTKAKLTVGSDGSLNFIDKNTNKPIPYDRGRIKAATTDVRTKVDLDRAGIAHRHSHALTQYINEVTKTKPAQIDSSRISKGQLRTVNFDPRVPTAEAAMDQAIHEREESALRRKITIANQPRTKRPPQHIRARTPSNTLSLKNVVNLRSIQIGGGGLLSTDVKPINVSNSLKLFSAISQPSNSTWQHPFGGPQIPKF